MSAQTKFRFLAAPMAVSVVAPMIAPVIVRAILLAALASGLTMAGQAAASESEAKAWIKKMGKALRSENYEGVFTYMRGTTSEAMRIVHLAQDGNETERLFNLNDEVLEVHRYNDQVNCLHPKRGANPQEAFRHSPVYIGPFSPLFAERVTHATGLYRASLHGESRIADRAAVKVAVSPPYNDRYGYRLWLDKQTGLLLRSHLVYRGMVREAFQFTHINIGGPISAERLASAIQGETISHPLTMGEPQDREIEPVWRVSWLPDGFRPVRLHANRQHFTDGVANMTVFVEQARSARLPSITTRGGTVVITHKHAGTGLHITVVGEVPTRTAQRVATSVEPVVY